MTRYAHMVRQPTARPDTVAVLQRIAARVRAGEPVDPGDAEWFDSVVDGYIQGARNGVSLDKLAGLAPAHGEQPWWRSEARRCRDDALRELARRFYPKLTTAQRAAAIETLARRYEATAWRVDRNLQDVPPKYVGTAKALLFEAFRSGAPIPRLRQLRSIIGNLIGDPIANDRCDALDL